jgi:hypothetical protein
VNLPTFNLNGDIPATILEAALEADRSLVATRAALRELAPHGRNYPAGGYDEARLDYESVMLMLDAAQRWVHAQRDHAHSAEMARRQSR